jgi:hypothetical protein
MQIQSCFILPCHKYDVHSGEECADARLLAMVIVRREMKNRSRQDQDWGQILIAACLLSCVHTFGDRPSVQTACKLKIPWLPEKTIRLQVKRLAILVVWDGFDGKGKSFDCVGRAFAKSLGRWSQVAAPWRRRA